MRNPRALVAFAVLAVAVASCDRTSPQAQQEERRAEAATREAGAKAGAAIEKAGHEVATEARRLEVKAQPTAEDLALTAKVKAKLAADPEVSALKIDVDTDKQVVTLTGTVDSDAERAEAEKLARDTGGVREVLNRIVAAPGGPAPAATPAH